MPLVHLAGIRACVFDAYGTLFDYASATAGCRDILGDKLDRLTTIWRDKQLQYTWLRTLAGHHADFWQVTGDALDFALETLEIENPLVRERLMRLYLRLEPFPEVRSTLEQLKAAGFKTPFCPMARRPCSTPPSITLGSKHCWILCSRSKRLESSLQDASESL